MILCHGGGGGGNGGGRGNGAGAAPMDPIDMLRMAVPGEPEIDYPIYNRAPDTGFRWIDCPDLDWWYWK